MTTVVQPNLVQEGEQPSPADGEILEQDAVNVDQERDEEELPERAGDIEEAEMMVHPFNTPIQVMGLCQKLKASLRAEIVHVLKSLEGTVIRLSLRAEESLLDFLAREDDVPEVWEELVSEEDRATLLPFGVDVGPVMKEGRAAIVCVSLKPSYIDALMDSQALTAAD